MILPGARSPARYGPGMETAYLVVLVAAFLALAGAGAYTVARLLRADR